MKGKDAKVSKYTLASASASVFSTLGVFSFFSFGFLCSLGSVVGESMCLSLRNEQEEVSIMVQASVRSIYDSDLLAEETFLLGAVGSRLGLLDLLLILLLRDSRKTNDQVYDH